MAGLESLLALASWCTSVLSPPPSRAMYQSSYDSYSGGNIDISGLVPSAIGSGTPTVAFGNNAELNRYKAQQMQMQSTQLGTQMDIMKSLDPHQSALVDATGAQVVQSHHEIMEVQGDSKVVQAASGAQVQAQYAQHLDTQRAQLGLGTTTRADEMLMTNTVGGLAMPHQAAYLATNMTTFSMMNQQRSDQLAALNQARQQQLAMLTETHTSTGMTTSNGYLPGSSDPTASFLGSTYGSPSLATYSAIQMTLNSPTNTSFSTGMGSTMSPTSTYSSITPSSSFTSSYSGMGSPISTTSMPGSFSTASSSTSLNQPISVTPAAISVVSSTVVAPSAHGPSVHDLSATATIVSFEAGAGAPAHSLTVQQASVVIHPKVAPADHYFEGYAD